MTLTPLEVLRLGIEAGHSPDVILASLEAAGIVCVPIDPTDEMVDAGWQHTGDPCWPENVKEAWSAMLSARPK